METKPTLLRLSVDTAELLKVHSKGQRRSMASLADEIIYKELVKRDQDLSRLDKVIKAAGKVT